MRGEMLSHLIESMTNREAKFPIKLGVLENRASGMLDNIENADGTNSLTNRLLDELDNSYVDLCKSTVSASQKLPIFLFSSVHNSVFPEQPLHCRV